MDRWVIFAIAHVRDGENLEYHWYKADELSWRTNTFNDVVDLTRHLIVDVLGTGTGYGGFPTLAIKRQGFGESRAFASPGRGLHTWTAGLLTRSFRRP